MSKRTYEILMKAVGWFIILDQIRKQIDEAEDARLAASIAQHGIFSPLGARHDGRLVWGHRRLRAAITAGLKEVPTVLLDKDMTEGEYLQLQVQENNARQALSGWEQWQAAESLLRAYPDWTNAELARAMSVDASMVPRLLAARKLIPEAQEAFRTGELGVAKMYDIALAGPADQPALLAGARNGLSAKKLAAASRQARNGTKAAGSTPPPATKRIKCVLPGKEPGKPITVVVSGEAITFADMIAVLKDLHRQAVQASEQGVIDARVFEGLCKDRLKSKRTEAAHAK